MQVVSVNAPNKLERRITVIVPVETIEQAYDKRILNLSKTVKANGFRPGKVPLDYIKNRYSDSARKEALSEVIQQSLYAAIRQEKLSPVSTPMVEPKTVMPGQPLEFVATFEVVPTIDSVNFELTTFEKEVAVIADVDVQNALNLLRQQHTVWQPVDRPAQSNDQVVVHFRGTVDGRPLKKGEAHDYPIVIGGKKMIPGFEDGLIGLKAGEEKILSLTFPENYFSKELAGKTADFAVTINKVSAPTLPDVDEAFIKKMGVKSGIMADFEVEIRKNLERELERLVKANLKKQLFDKLLEQNLLEIPRALIESESKRIHDQLHPNHAGHEHDHSEEEIAKFNEMAKRNVLLGLLVAQLIKQNNLAVDQERLQAYLKSLSSIYEDPAQAMAWYSGNKKAMSEIEMQVLEEQVMEKLLEGVQMTEKVFSYTELMRRLSTAKPESLNKENGSHVPLPS